jgi:hypothetical protein
MLSCRFCPRSVIDAGDVMEWNYLNADDDADTRLY